MQRIQFHGSLLLAFLLVFMACAPLALAEEEPSLSSSPTASAEATPMPTAETPRIPLKQAQEGTALPTTPAETPHDIPPKHEQDGAASSTPPGETPCPSSGATLSPPPATANPTPVPSAPPASPAASPSPSLAPATPQPTAQETLVSITAASAQYACVYGEPFSFGAQDLLVDGTPMETWANETDTANRARFVNALLAGIAYNGSLSMPTLPGIYSIAVPACKAGGYASASTPVAALSIDKKPVSLLVQGNWQLRFTGKALSVPSSACTFASGNSTPLKDAEIALLMGACHFSVAEGKTLKNAGNYTILVSLEESVAQLYALSTSTLALTVEKAVAPQLSSQEITPSVGCETEYQLNLTSLLPASCGAFSATLAESGDGLTAFSFDAATGLCTYSVLPQNAAPDAFTLRISMANYADATLRIDILPVARAQSSIDSIWVDGVTMGAISEYLCQKDAVRRSLCATLFTVDDAPMENPGTQEKWP